jgi:paraquat-inducible protein A
MPTSNYPLLRDIVVVRNLRSGRELYSSSHGSTISVTFPLMNGSCFAGGATSKMFAESTSIMLSRKACHCCGLIHQLPHLEHGERAVCTRCHTAVSIPGCRVTCASRTAAAALAAFVLFWPAVLCPILEIEQLGNRHRSSILSGIIHLFRDGSWLVGGVILLFSIIFPLTKIVLLLELSLLEFLHRRHKAMTLRIMEHIGKWSMMDVMLLALLVMLVKLGNVVEFHFGPAVIAFILCVGLSMIASLSFDPHAIWEDSE